MNKKYIIALIFTAALLIFATGCNKVNNEQNNQAGLANPASAYCEENGGKIEMRETDGGATGWCIFPDGSECEEWAYYRGECQPGTNWQENPIVAAIRNGELLQCIVGRDNEGRNQFKIVKPEDGCPGANNEQALREFCGKDTVKVAYCEGAVKLDSSVAGAGSIFYKDGKILTCPAANFPEISDDCKNAINTECTLSVDCQ